MGLGPKAGWRSTGVPCFLDLNLDLRRAYPLGSMVTPNTVLLPHSSIFLETYCAREVFSALLHPPTLSSMRRLVDELIPDQS